MQCILGVGLTDKSSMRPSERVSGPHDVFDALYFLLVAAPVLHGSFFSLGQRVLQRPNPLGRRAQTLLQLRKLAAQICVITNQLSEREAQSNKTQSCSGSSYIHVSHILQICKWGYYNTINNKKTRCKKCNCSQGEEQELTYLTNLFVNFCKLFQVVLEKGDLLFLCWTPPALIRLQLRALKHTQLQLHIKHIQKHHRLFESNAVLCHLVV